MPQSVEAALKVWLSPFLIVALCTVCGFLWADMRQQQRDTAERLSQLNDTVIALKAVAGK